ncbi:hypothetical protein JRO89_XS05G0210200 [Xanthoceras sorbifolium]|uniref:CRAL-TRIO domain-containing protein n=1 Tax=Xanthoceras sorbifolium TaxID=99658 RepID=A0ABQ8I2M2_9ROSI|nr:hypothetical protein JRO89_XS05G0210200 [Xanthoceras sorbifolium]
MAARDEVGSGSQSNKQRFEAIKEKQERMSESIAALTATFTHSLERIERRLAEIKERELIDRRTHGEERQSQGSRYGVGFSEVDEGNHGVRLGGRVEWGPLVVQRWLHDRDSEAELGEGFDEEDRRFDRITRDRMPVYERQRGLPRRETDVWRLVSRFIEKATLEKIVIVTSEEEKKDFVTEVGEELLPEEYGGRAKLITFQDVTVPHLSDVSP